MNKEEHESFRRSSVSWGPACALGLRRHADRTDWAAWECCEFRGYGPNRRRFESTRPDRSNGKSRSSFLCARPYRIHRADGPYWTARRARSFVGRATGTHWRDRMHRTCIGRGRAHRASRRARRARRTRRRRTKRSKRAKWPCRPDWTARRLWAQWLGLYRFHRSYGRSFDGHGAYWIHRTYGRSFHSDRPDRSHRSHWKHRTNRPDRPPWPIWAQRIWIHRGHRPGGSSRKPGLRLAASGERLGAPRDADDHDERQPFAA